MDGRSWYWRKFGFWFTPVRSGTPGREEWTKIRQLSRYGRSRGSRRLLVVAWVGLLGFDAWVALFCARQWTALGLLSSVILLSFAWFAFHRMRISLAQPTLEDRAVMEYGAEFDALQEKQRGEIAQQAIRDNLRGRIWLDEREAELRLQSEGAAYRLLRPGLVIVIAVYWAVCLLGPFEAIREALTVTAIAFTWLAVAVLVLPTMVRMWTQPNEVGEPRIAGAENEA